MLEVEESRGWVSDDDIGENDKYYLYNSEKFFTISVHSSYKDNDNRMIMIDSGAELGSLNIHYSDGGVQKKFYMKNKIGHKH